MLGNVTGVEIWYGPAITSRMREMKLEGELGSVSAVARGAPGNVVCLLHMPLHVTELAVVVVAVLKVLGAPFLKRAGEVFGPFPSWML